MDEKGELPDCGKKSAYDAGFIRARAVKMAGGSGCDISEKLAAALSRLEIKIEDGVESTNAALSDAARLGEISAPTLMIARRQTLGRGRLGRSWHFEEDGSVALSLAYNFPKGTKSIESLTVLCGLEICKAFKKYFSAPFMLKWPNDVYLSGRKLCGMLANLHVNADGTFCAVFGVGVNLDVKKFPEELRGKTANLSEVSAEPEANEVSALLAFSIMKAFLILESGRSPAVPAAEYAEFDWLQGKEIRAVCGSEEYEGVAAGVSPSGELLIEKSGQKGNIVRLNSGEATIRK